MNYDDSRGFETPFSFSNDTVSFAKPSQKTEQKVETYNLKH